MPDVKKLELVVVGENFRFDPDALLEAAKGQDFTNLVILGRMPDGEVWVSGMANVGDALVLMEHAKRIIVFGDE